MPIYFLNLCEQAFQNLTGKVRLLVESNNHGMTSVHSESLNNLLSNSPDTDESQDSLTAPLHLTGAALARRLNVSPSTLRHKKNARNFGQWTSRHDPDAITWYFDGQKFVSSYRSEKVKPFE
jgi:hypothetical protein